MQEYLKCGNRYPRPIRKQQYLPFSRWPAGEVVKFMLESEISTEKRRLLPELLFLAFSPGIPYFKCKFSIWVEKQVYLGKFSH
jgi:hypothetical protein